MRCEVTCRIISVQMAGLHVFYDSFSQPSRAVLLLLHANNVKFEPHVIRIGKGRTGNRRFWSYAYFSR